MDLTTGKAIFALYDELILEYNRLSRVEFLEAMLTKCAEFSKRHDRRANDLLVAMQAHFQAKKEGRFCIQKEKAALVSANLPPC